MFRIFVAIPIMILPGTVTGRRWRYTTQDRLDADASSDTLLVAGAGGILFLGLLLIILFRQKSPRWWFDWSLELQRFSSRVGSTWR